VLDGIERIRIKPRGEGVVDEKVRDGEQAGVTRIFQAIALESAKIVRVTKLGAELLKEILVMLMAFRANLLLQMTLKVGGNQVVIEQRIVDVKKKNEIGHAGLMDDRKLYSDGEALGAEAVVLFNPGRPGRCGAHAILI